jgi:hypothetical protein
MSGCCPKEAPASLAFWPGIQTSGIKTNPASAQDRFGSTVMLTDQPGTAVGRAFYNGHGDGSGYKK